MLPRVKYNIYMNQPNKDNEYVEGNLLGLVTKPQSTITYGIGGGGAVVNNLNTNPLWQTYAIIGFDDGSIAEILFTHCRYVKPITTSKSFEPKDDLVKALRDLDRQPSVSKRGDLIMLDYEDSDASSKDADLAFDILTEIFGF